MRRKRFSEPETLPLVDDDMLSRQDRLFWRTLLVILALALLVSGMNLVLGGGR